MAGFQNGSFRAELGTGTAAGGVASVANPEGRTVYVTVCLLNITSATSGACTLDAGIAANGTTLSDTLIDGLNANAAAGVFSNLKDGGSNGKAGQPWGADEYLTVSQASGAVAGLEGELIVEYITV